MNSVSILPWAIAYILLFLGSSFGILMLLKRQRTRRFPLPENTKLLRMPGEQLWRELTRSEENDNLFLICAVLFPLVSLVAFFPLIRPFLDVWPIPAIIMLISVFTVSTWLAGRFMAKRLFKRGDMLLGFFGERYVGEHLDDLKKDGWAVYHDVPFEGATGRFNIDHVALSRFGIWIVETKTRRKGDARPGFKDHEVLADGGKLIWPWGEDETAIKQASSNAKSVEEWLQQLTGHKIPVSAVVALPGWMVVEKNVKGIRVTNPKILCNVIRRSQGAPLTEEQFSLFCRQLDQKCRDVSY